MHKQLKMASEFKKWEYRQGGRNRLITTPKQTRPMLTRSALENCILNYAYTYTDSAAEEVIISKVSFCKDLTITLSGFNKLVIIEDCIFHGDMTIHCLKDVKIILRNCRFRGHTNLASQKPGVVDMRDCAPTRRPANRLSQDTYYLSDIATLNTIILS